MIKFLHLMFVLERKESGRSRTCRENKWQWVAVAEWKRKLAKASFLRAWTTGEWSPSLSVLFCEVRILISVVITSFYCSKLLGFLKAGRMAKVILPVMSTVTVVGGQSCFHLDYCLVSAVGLLLQQTLADPALITLRLKWLNIDHQPDECINKHKLRGSMWSHAVCEIHKTE